MMTWKSYTDDSSLKNDCEYLIAYNGRGSMPFTDYEVAYFFDDLHNGTAGEIGVHESGFAVCDRDGWIWYNDVDYYCEIERIEL